MAPLSSCFRTRSRASGQASQAPPRATRLPGKPVAPRRSAPCAGTRAAAAPAASSAPMGVSVPVRRRILTERLVSRSCGLPRARPSPASSGPSGSRRARAHRRELHCLLAVHGDTDHFDPLILREHGHQRLGKEPLVVRDEDANALPDRGTEGMTRLYGRPARAAKSRESASLDGR